MGVIASIVDYPLFDDSPRIVLSSTRIISSLLYRATEVINAATSQLSQS